MFWVITGSNVATALEATTKFGEGPAAEAQSSATDRRRSQYATGAPTLEPTFRKPRPALPREADNPFYYSEAASNEPLQRLKKITYATILVPLRVLYITLLIVLYWLLEMIIQKRGCHTAANEVDNLSKVSCLFRYIAGTLPRWSILGLGYLRVNRRNKCNYGRRADGSRVVGPVIVANHVTIQDGLLLLFECDASLVTGNLAEANFTSMLLRGRTYNGEDRRIVKSLDLKHRQKTQEEIDSTEASTNNNPQTEMSADMSDCNETEVREGGEGIVAHVVFPEPCCTNGRVMMRFSTDAFATGLPVQPVVLRHSHKYFNTSWCGAASPTSILLGTAAQLFNQVEVIYLPVCEPSKEEKLNPSLYAERVRRAMASTLNVPATWHSEADVHLALVAARLSLPVDAVNVETAHPHFAGMPYDRVVRMLYRFSALLQRSDGGPQPQMNITPKGYMSPTALGRFLSPIGLYPTLNERLLLHLSRRASVRGCYISFRDFLSALYTEPIIVGSSDSHGTSDKTGESSVPSNAHMVFIDELQKGEADDEVALDFILRRTFAMMLLAGEDLLRQQEKYRSHIKDTFVTVGEVQGAGQENVEAGDANVISCAESPLPTGTCPSSYTTVYGCKVRFLFRPCQNINRCAPVAASLAATALSVEERRLGRAEFDALLDMLFVPHHSTLWRGPATKSQVQLAEEDSLFSYIRSGATEEWEATVGKKTVQIEEVGRGTNRSGEYITFDAFLRFCFRHRAMAEYFHACCEHFLLCDDLA
ncbi:hypothetical protein DPX39_100044800 [Trypanosoma brucei equiperdum]|uniref:Acyltransferase n=1 Tax=Trypanosoma brucei equiperdum TaxID=630700 RepID=A0A3L6L0D8_9TRYP|nr:hypothetical protein DPX39_100044800 [Trypanosoma brucei equiperdum]